MRRQNEIERMVADGLGDASEGEVRDEMMIALDEIYAAGPDLARIKHAQSRLRRTLDRIYPADVYYGRMSDSPVGPIMIGVSDKGLLAIRIGNSEEAFISQLEKRFQASVSHSQEKVTEVVHQLREYFAGQRASFELRLFLEDLTPFQRRVLLKTLEIPRGQITNYGEIARRLGKVHAARAVGQALARNPIPIVIPCHRVLGADGSLHGYTGGRGLKTKKRLLELEGGDLRL